MSVNRNPKTGLWDVQVWYRTYEGARKKKHRRGFKTKSAGRDWERQFLLRANGSPSMSFADFVGLYKEDVRPLLKRNTFLTKAHILDTKLVPVFGEMKLNEITPSDVLRWQGRLGDATNPKTGRKYSMTYVRTVCNQLSAVFNHACRYYGLGENPMRQVGKIGKRDADEMQIWTVEEYGCFSEAIMDKPQAFTAFEVLFWTGIREGELLALTPGDFDFGKDLLHITKSFQRIRGEDVITPPKTPKSNRVIAMPNGLAEEVEEYIALFGVGDGERVFPFTKSFLYREMGRGCKRSGVKRIRVHDLRHSHVSLLIDKGFTALAIADRLGHEAVDVTYRYAHLFPSVQRDMADALQNLRGDGK